MSKYSKEFKQDALLLCERRQREAGRSTKALYNWKRAQRLERKLEEIREANHILKKAMGFMMGR